MTFDIIRLGLPNTAAIVALAIMPVMALTTLADPRPAAGQIEQRQVEQRQVEQQQVEQIELAAICQAPVECTEIAVAAAPEFAAE